MNDGAVSLGADTLRRSLADWLSDMELVQAGNTAVLDRYIGYYGTVCHQP